jgi:hypothetical protein
MNSTPIARSNLLVLALGAAIVGGFFMPWTDSWVGGISGWSFTTDWGMWRYLLVPLAGLALIAAAVLSPALVPAAAIAVGGGITAWFGWHMASVTAAVYGWGITMVVGGAVFAIAGALIKKPSMSAVGGFTMIGGFFCPWIDPGHISGFELARANGLGAIAIAAWLVPIGGALAAYGAGNGDRGRGMAGFGGLVGLGAIGYLTYRLLGGVLMGLAGWGYFLVVAAGIAALVVGIRRARAPRVVKL